MREGLLWYDADPKRAPQAKLDDARRRYVERYGLEANCCHVAPDEVFAHPEVQIVANPAVLPHHFWIGRDETLVAPRKTRLKRSA
jgi:hypothetical protein